MNIIVVSPRLPKAITLNRRELLLLALGAGLLVLAIAWMAAWGALQLSRWLGWQLPANLPMLSSQQARVDSLAIKLGEVQAKLLRLDGLSTQVAQQVGIDPKPFQSAAPAAQGGVLHGERPLSAAELTSAIGRADRDLDAQLDALTLADAMLRQSRMQRWQLPTQLPVDSAVKSSSFGWRIDPITGRETFHEGLDFPGNVGTAINAAAAGRVITAEHHPQYGNMVEIDHGNGISSRYAHAQQLLVSTGSQVRAGQKVALLGNTGRSTGPHLHFEIRYKGVAQNPLHFLALPGNPG